MSERGIVAVWSGGEAISYSFRIPRAGLVLGRDLLATTTDQKLSRAHARVDDGERQLFVQDLGSRNGTFVGGLAIGERNVGVVARSVIRTGQTVWIAVDDIDDPQVDAVVTKIVDAVRAIEPTIEIHATAIEACMVQYQRAPEHEEIVECARRGARARTERSGPLRGDDIEPPLKHPPVVGPHYPKPKKRR